METVYEKYKAASEYLMEYYTWVDLLGIERREFEEHAEAIERHCKKPVSYTHLTLPTNREV